MIMKKKQKKYLKLSLVFASLVGLLISSNHSFAKYIDSNYGGGNAGAARFNVNFDTIASPISVASLDTDDVGKTCAFVASFNVDFGDCEVSTSYNLSLRLGASSISDDPSTLGNEAWDASWNELSKTGHQLTNTSFITSVGNNSVISLIKQSDGSYDVGNFSQLTKNNLYSNGKAYYGVGTKANNGTISYNWQSTNLDSDNLTLTICNAKEASPADVHYYSVVFFIKVTTSNNVKISLENSVMLYDMHIEQEA